MKRLIKATFAGYDGSLGYHTQVVHYDEQERLVKVAYFDEAGNPARHRDGYASFTASHDDRDNRIEEAYFDEAGAPCRCKEGFSHWRKVYDEGSRVVETAFAGYDGSLGFHTLVEHYDEQGRLRRATYFDEAGNPARHRDGFAIVIVSYDEGSNRTEAYFDEAGRTIHPVLSGCGLVLGVMAAYLLPWCVAKWLPTEYTCMWIRTFFLLIVSNALALYLAGKLTYEWRVSRRAGFTRAVVVRGALCAGLLLAGASLGAVLLRPLPFLLVLAAPFGIVLITKSVLALSVARHHPQWVAFLQIGLLLNFALLYPVTGLSRFEDLEFFVIPLTWLCVLLWIVALGTAWVVDRATLRWLLAGERTGRLDQRSLRTMLAFARAESPSGVGLYSSMKRQAIRSLGHMPYDAEVMEALVGIVEQDRSPYLRDAACEAITEIRRRQCESGRTQGRDALPRSSLSGKAGEELRVLRVIHSVLAGIAVIILLPFAIKNTAEFAAGFIDQNGSPSALEGFVLSRLYQDRAAVDVYERCVANGGQSAAVCNSLAWIRAISSNPAIRDPQAAIKYASQSVSADGYHNPYYLNTLAEAYYQAGMQQEAREALDRAIQRAPENKFFQTRRRKLEGE